MESQPQNPEFRINPENFHPCVNICYSILQQGNRSCKSQESWQERNEMCLLNYIIGLLNRFHQNLSKSVKT